MKKFTATIGDVPLVFGERLNGREHHANIMSERREVPNQSPDHQSSNTKLERIGATVRRRALSGSEASTVGFTLVIYIFAGAGLGYLLDKNLETTYWIAIGMLFGTVVGFREMFRLTNKLTKANALDNDGDSAFVTSAASAAPAKYSVPATSAQETESEFATERTRIFSVPSPPSASFDPQQRCTPVAPSKPLNSPDELIERLLNDGDEANNETK